MSKVKTRAKMEPCKKCGSVEFVGVRVVSESVVGRLEDGVFYTEDVLDSYYILDEADNMEDQMYCRECLTLLERE